MWVLLIDGTSFARLPQDSLLTFCLHPSFSSSQDSYSTTYGFFIMTPVQQIRRYALKVVSRLPFNAKSLAMASYEALSLPSSCCAVQPYNISQSPMCP